LIAGGTSGPALRSSSPLDTEAFMEAIMSGLVEDGELNEESGIKFFYLDVNNNPQGPFRCIDMFSWYQAGYIHEQVQVCVGEAPRTMSNPKGAPFVPFAIFLDALKVHFTKKSVKSMVSWAHDDGELFKHKTDKTRMHWEWDFNIFNYSEDDLIYLSAAILESLNIPLVFSVSESSFRGFMDNVRYLMTRNCLPYHNYYHALDVMQTCFVFVESFEASNYITEMER